MEIEIKKCPLCEMEIVSETGMECMMCGMSIEDGDFCSMKCEDTYEMIHEIEILEGKKNGIIQKEMRIL